MHYTCGVCCHDHDSSPSLYDMHLDYAVEPMPRIAAAILVIAAFVIGCFVGWISDEFIRNRPKQLTFNALPDYVQPVGFAKAWDKENKI